jgi:hypothetical protein
MILTEDRLSDHSEGPQSDIHRLRSWLPVDAVVCEGRPAIEWLNMSGVVLAEPFFDQTVARARKETAAEPLITDLEELIRLEKVSDSLQPSGFIFHSSRCGSTLVANACRSLRDSLVVAEAAVLDKLISRLFTDTDETGTKSLLYSVFLRAAVSALGQRRGSAEQHYFIKFAPTSILQFARIRRIWPRVPALFLYRDPIEVMVSNLQNIPDWMKIEPNPGVSAAVLGLGQSELASMSLEELCARALGRFYAAAAAEMDENTLLCNHNELSPETLLRLISFFGVSVSTEEAEAITRQAGLYSKDPLRQTHFSDDAPLKRANASTYVTEMAERWALPSFRRLVELQQLRFIRESDQLLTRD